METDLQDVLLFKLTLINLLASPMAVLFAYSTIGAAFYRILVHTCYINAITFTI